MNTGILEPTGRLTMKVIKAKKEKNSNRIFSILYDANPFSKGIT